MLYAILLVLTIITFRNMALFVLSAQTAYAGGKISGHQQHGALSAINGISNAEKKGNQQRSA